MVPDSIHTSLAGSRQASAYKHLPVNAAAAAAGGGGVENVTFDKKQAHMWETQHPVGGEVDDNIRVSTSLDPDMMLNLSVRPQKLMDILRQ